MPSFEKIRSAAVEGREGARAIDERRAALDRVMNALPGLRPVILAFVTSTALMSAPEYVRAHTDEATAESTQEKGPGSTPEAIFEIPPAAFYEHRMSLDSSDGNENIVERSDGAMPESAENIVIGVNRHTFSRLETVNGEGHINSTFSDDFYMLPIEGEMQAADGVEPFEMKGVGETPQEALRNALEEAAHFMGVYVESEKSLKESSDTQEATSDFSDRITTRAAHPIKGYRVVEQHDDSVDGIQGVQGYTVTVEIVPAGA